MIEKSLFLLGILALAFNPVIAVKSSGGDPAVDRHAWTQRPQGTCVLPDNGGEWGTVDLPPEGCAYLSPDEVHMIIDGLPPGTTIELAPIHRSFFNINRAPGGVLGGQIETFDSTLELQLTGTGDLAGFNRVLEIPIFCEVHT
jgi:hypothetical protein